MKLRKLIKDLPLKAFKGSKDVEITGICANSKVIVPGNLFVARKGRADDGSQYIPEAVAGGAVAVLTDIYDPSLKDISQLIYPDVTEIEGLVAASYYQFPSDELFLVGITGTNGKTTTTFLVKHLLNQYRGPCGLIGTIEYIVGQHRYQATRTTPDVTSNHKMLREMLREGCRSAAMEVTSHGLDQGRVQNIDFDIAIFTNLTLEHLDYHQTMENYCQTKNRLFRGLDPARKKKNGFKGKQAVINVDSPWANAIVEGCKAPIVSYGILNEDAMIRASDVELTGTGTRFDVTYKGQKSAFHIPLVGRFNVYNCLAAAAVGLALEIPLKDISECLATAPTVPGRLQPVPNPLGLKIYVDFAHSDDALINVLECLQELKKGRIITIFGCGGDRDRTKRPKMAHAAEEYSDYCILTTDNPRSEDPAAIAEEARSGFRKKDGHEIELDRRKAIEKAIRMATPDDIIFIAGKGHETYQIFAHKTIEFDDAKVAAQLCRELSAKEIFT